MVSAAPLSTIIALARAGALDHAWREFGAAGFDVRDDDPAALTVKGRLLKDRALRAQGDERRRLYLEAAEAYRRSAALRPGTYPLINAATLSLLSGDRGQAEAIAREVIERIAREPDEPETPYWRAATEAEALLLLGRQAEARDALEAAVAAAPRAWEDHASTLRQFLAIDELLGIDSGWLEALRPPPSIHISGHWSLPEGVPPAELCKAVDAVLAGRPDSFAYGALTAGTDLVIAEALLERGAQLHLILPSDTESFAARFVDPLGGDWRARFDGLVEAAEAVEHVRPLLTAPDPAMLALADEIALGAALLNAERLMGEVVRLEVGGEESGSDAPGLRCHAVAAPAGARLIEAEGASGAWARPLALLLVGVGASAEPDFEARLADVKRALTDLPAPAIPPHLDGETVRLGFADPAEAAAAARGLHAALHAELPLRIAGHFGPVRCVEDPFVGQPRPVGSAAEIADTIARSMPPDTIAVSRDFAALLAVRAPFAHQAAWIGELQTLDGGSPIGLYALDRSSAL